MATHRDEVRAARSEAYRKAAELGIDMEPERAKINSNQRTLAYDAIKLVNDPTPRLSRESLQVDDPPSGAFNGSNTQFGLSEPVVGENIVVIWVDASSGTKWTLVKGNANPPAIHEFFFDRNDPTQFVMNPAPAPSDALVAVYKVKR